MQGPFLLIVIDGFGLAPDGPGNAITQASTPVFDGLFARFPHCGLEASGLDVGLPAGVMGNSEVGHLNIGAGRVVPQDIVRIDQSIDSGAFFDNKALRGALESVKSSAHPAGRRPPCLHLMGLYSDGNVHSCDAHVRALIDLAARELPPEQVLVHVFTDGRDTPPRSGDRYVAELSEHCAGKATIVTVSGRYYAMDRDKRWERTELAFRAVVDGGGETSSTAVQAVAEAYARDEGDEFIRPTVLEAGRALCADGGPLMRPGDAAVFWNYRADRARQLCSALTEPEFDGFDGRAAGETLAGRLQLVSLTQYSGEQRYEAAYAPETLRDTLGDTWAGAGLRQLHIAETEKYAHVTYFFNGGREELLHNEERALIQSPKVATYDLQPRMSALEVTEELLGRIRGGSFDCAVLNLANPDMVGHTGVISATRESVEVVDGCVGRLVEAVLARGGMVAVTADHGNAEQMLDPSTGLVHTAHTTNLVPLILCGGPEGALLGSGGRLCDVAPTVLEVLRLERPYAMTGRSLLSTP